MTTPDKVDLVINGGTIVSPDAEYRASIAVKDGKIHAIGAAFIGVIHDMTKQAPSNADPNERYHAELEQLSAESWRRSG